jgi:hypothetical protein
MLICMECDMHYCISNVCVACGPCLGGHAFMAAAYSNIKLQSQKRGSYYVASRLIRP